MLQKSVKKLLNGIKWEQVNEANNTCMYCNIILKCYRNEAQYLQCIFSIQMWQKKFSFRCFPQQIMLAFRLLDKLYEVKYHIYYSKKKINEKWKGEKTETFIRAHSYKSIFWFQSTTTFLLNSALHYLLALPQVGWHPSPRRMDL